MADGEGALLINRCCLDTQLVQVRTARNDSVLLETQQLGYMSGRDPVTGLPYVWKPEPVEVVLPLSVLSELEADPRLEVRRVDPRLQASKRMELAIAADKAATEAAEHAKQLRAKADMLFEEAQKAQDEAGANPVPPKTDHGTPWTDQRLAGLPASVRAEIEKMEPMAQAKELRKPIRQRLAEGMTIPEGEYEKAVADAFPNHKAAQDEILAHSPIAKSKKAK